jgi:hypothetical protein
VVHGLTGAVRDGEHGLRFGEDRCGAGEAAGTGAGSDSPGAKPIEPRVRAPSLVEASNGLLGVARCGAPSALPTSPVVMAATDVERA